MPTLSTPTLTLGATDNGKRDVTVAGSITFDAGDVGKTYRLEIKLFGEDKTGDVLPSGDALGDDQIYVYNFTGPLLPRPYKVITVAAAGALNYSEKRAVNTSSLDEDPGNQLVGKADIHTPVFMPRKDEVYASVTISGAPVTKKSATVVSGIGV
ncbi:hypothetical protein [Piscinibacter gummiphilus]|uniref:Uncharacterized protein n=1 Tax=Piscinibacter gummiphilus TaxID=946333 RepID=A0ABZ0CPC6_9BURK|nr:hypothetical protein [Piscinibacter gummiphilus]WOB06835.1 hypothetical protein RXV79_18150 [Piscinibacter gummiphilus]